jgi:pyruvate carboxylase subunit B
MKYFVSVEGRTIEVEVDGDRVRVGERVFRAELRSLPGTPVRNLLVDGESWIVPMEPLAPGRWLLQRRGERFEAEVEDERTRHIRGLIGSGTALAAPPVLKAPMPGLVVRILVAAGHEVAAGAGLVVLEAMKMENELKAVAPGIVDQVRVTAGQAVEKGAVLLTFRAGEATAR